MALCFVHHQLAGKPDRLILPARCGIQVPVIAYGAKLSRRVTQRSGGPAGQRIK